MTDYRCMFSTSDRHRKLNQLRWQNMSAHLTNEISYWLKKLLMHLNWAIYNACDLNIYPHVCFFSRPCHRIGLGQYRWHSQRPVRNAARGLYALAHHTEAETATQGKMRSCWNAFLWENSQIMVCWQRHHVTYKLDCQKPPYVCLSIAAKLLIYL